jgi:hypothetical protein
MAISTDDLRNYSFVRITGTSAAPTTTTLGVLYKLRNLTSASSAIANAIIISGDDCFLSITGSGNDPLKVINGGNVEAIALVEKVSNNILARWEYRDFTVGFPTPVFQNNIATNGANYATWLAFTTALVDFISKPNS